MNSVNLAPASIQDLAVLLVALPPGHPLVIAARVALDLRQDCPLWADDYAAGGRYHRQHTLPEYAELQRHRYPPTGNRELWIKYGPAGPPSAQTTAVAA